MRATLRDRVVHCLAGLALAALAALPACATGLVEVVNEGGLACRFETPNSIDVVNDDTGLYVKSSTYAVDIVDGRVTLDGVDHGTVKAGDNVHVTRDGRLFVNGVQRLAGGAR